MGAASVRLAEYEAWIRGATGVKPCPPFLNGSLSCAIAEGVSWMLESRVSC